jgi:LacI family transcriptional regulator
MTALRLLAPELLEIRQRYPVRVVPMAQERAQKRLKSRSGRDGRRRLAILIAEFWNPPRRNAFYGTLVAGIQQEASRGGHSAEVVALPLRQQVETAERVVCGGYDAAIFIAFTAEYMASIIPFHESRFPLLIFNRRIPGYELPTVTLDDYGVSQRLVRHLAEMGHRNLCLVASHDCHGEVTPQPIKGRGRTIGWTDALVEQGLIGDCVLPVYAPWDYEPAGIYEGMFRRLLRSTDRPTAIVFSHNPLARRFLADAEFARLAVPEDISMATFEPATSIPHTPGRPPLTSIHIDPHRTAQCVLETVEKIITGAAHPPTIRMPFTIDLTESIGPVRGRPADSALAGR